MLACRHGNKEGIFGFAKQIGFVFKSSLFLILSAGFLIPILNAYASGPSSNRLLNYQIRLTDTNGIPVPDGTLNIKISFYTALTGGTPTATDCGLVGAPVARKVIFTNGVGSVLIGDTAAGITTNCSDASAPNAIGTGLFANTSLFLGITVASDSEMSPRKRIVASGYAMNADQLDDLESSSTGGTTAFVPVTDSAGLLTLTGNPTTTTAVITANPAAAVNELLMDLKTSSVSKFSVDAEGDVLIAGTLGVTGATTLSSSLALLAGTDYSTTGIQNNVSLGSNSLVRYTGVAEATFTGIAGGSNGKILTIMNASTNSLSFENESLSSTAANRIITGDQNILVVTYGAMVTFQYDATTSRWRVLSTSTAVGNTAFVQSGNAFNASAVLGTNDNHTLSLETNNVTRATFDAANGLSLPNGLAITSANTTNISVTTGTTGVLTLDSGTIGAVKLGTNNNAKTISIGTGNAGNTINIGANGAIVDFVSGAANNKLYWKIPKLAAGGCTNAVDEGIVIKNANDQVGHLCIDATGVLNIFATFHASQTDIAEMYSTNPAENIQAGDVVQLDDTSDIRYMVKKSTGAYSTKVFGVISTKPGLSLSGINETTGLADTTNGRLVALKGRVPVKVTTANGAIAIGDYLAASNMTGVAMKATRPGMVLGRALTSYGGNGVGLVEMFVEVGWNGLASIGSDGSALIFTDSLVLDKLVPAGPGGDLKLAGNLYPSDRGVLQSSKYLYYDGSAGPGGDMMRTNAAGWGTGSYDFAEMFPSSDNLVSGEIVMIDADRSIAVKKARQSTNTGPLAGVVSTRPGFLAGTNDVGAFPIAMSGRVPTKVSVENGPILIGDAITVSSQNGVGMKAVSSGYVVGYALETWSGAGEGKIMVFVQAGFWNGSTIAQVTNTVSGNTQLTTLTADLDVAGFKIKNVASIVSANNTWSIDEFGNMKTRGTFAARIATSGGEQLIYATMSSKVEITVSGSGQLSGGSARIDFDQGTKDVISLTTPLKISATLTGAANGIYVASKDIFGFNVREVAGGVSNATFDYVVVARRRGFEDVEVVTPAPANTVIVEPVPNTEPAANTPTIQDNPPTPVTSSSTEPVVTNPSTPVDVAPTAPASVESATNPIPAAPVTEPPVTTTDQPTTPIPTLTTPSEPSTPVTSNPVVETASLPVEQPIVTP